MENRRSSSNTSGKPYRKKNYKKREERSYGNQDGYSSKRNKRNSSEGRYSKPTEGFRSNKGKYNPKKRFNKPGKGTPPWKKQPFAKIVSDLQITDGKHRGKYLKSSESPRVKPTVRSIREVMFKILFRRVRAGRFLDLCAGSGTVGLEAISRAALVCSFVERKAKLCTLIKKNMESLGVNEGHGEVFETEVVPFLKKMAKRRRFWDVVYFNPPFDTNYDEVLKYFERGVTIKPGGILVIEHHSDMFFPERIGVMKRWRVIVKGESTISFYDRKS